MADAPTRTYFTGCLSARTSSPPPAPLPRPKTFDDQLLWRRAVQPTGFFRRAHTGKNPRVTLNDDTTVKAEPIERAAALPSNKKKPTKTWTDVLEKQNEQYRQSLRLLAVGLAEEDPHRSSVHALKSTPTMFRHPDLPEEDKVEFRPHQLHATGKINHIVNSPNVHQTLHSSTLTWVLGKRTSSTRCCNSTGARKRLCS
jgi:hypothetical protein